MDNAAEARRALTRLNRAVEKAVRELDAVVGALQSAEGTDFPEEEFTNARVHLDGVVLFVDEQQRRLQEKIMLAGGLEPGRIRRTGPS